MITVFIILTLIVFIALLLRPDKATAFGSSEYDENGNHLYYDRKLIRKRNKNKRKHPLS